MTKLLAEWRTQLYEANVRLAHTAAMIVCFLLEVPLFFFYRLVATDSIASKVDGIVQTFLGIAVVIFALQHVIAITLSPILGVIAAVGEVAMSVIQLIHKLRDAWKHDNEHN